MTDHLEDLLPEDWDYRSDLLDRGWRENPTEDGLMLYHPEVEGGRLLDLESAIAAEKARR